MALSDATYNVQPGVQTSIDLRYLGSPDDRDVYSYFEVVSPPSHAEFHDIYRDNLLFYRPTSSGPGTDSLTVRG